jgi:hypothetical protein
MVEPTKKHISILILDNFVRDSLKNWTDDLETNLSIDGMSHTLHFVLMELIGNAVKANLKRVYFRKHNYDMNDPESYRRGVIAFMRDYNSIDEEEYKQAMQQMDFNVQVKVDVNQERLLIFVENTSVLLDEEERRIRSKLAGSSDIENIVDFSLHFGDDTEGRGLGLAMIVLLMKDLGFDPGFFRVFQTGEKTVARLEFPLNADYVPIRNRINRALS